MNYLRDFISSSVSGSESRKLQQPFNNNEGARISEGHLGSLIQAPSRALSSNSNNGPNFPGSTAIRLAPGAQIPEPVNTLLIVPEAGDLLLEY